MSFLKKEKDNYFPQYFWVIQKWNLPNKIKYFSWLVIHHLILAWHNLQRRGFHGQGICIMCRKGEEDSNHLFLHCPYTKAIWDSVLDYFNIAPMGHFKWLFSCISSWIKVHCFIALLLYILWTIWLRLNAIFFIRK